MMLCCHVFNNASLVRSKSKKKYHGRLILRTLVEPLKMFKADNGRNPDTSRQEKKKIGNKWIKQSPTHKEPTRSATQDNICI